jgi:hypothetical protein
MLPGNERDQQANSRSFLFGLVMLVVFLSLQSAHPRPSHIACRWLVVALSERGRETTSTTSSLNPRWHLRKKTCGGHYELLFLISLQALDM